MKKIGILLNTSWYIYNFRKNLIKELQNNGYKVVAIAPNDDYSSKLEELGCEYYRLEMNSKSKNPLYDLDLMMRMRKVLSHVKPDILLNFTIKPNVYGSMAARTLGIKCINNVAGMGTLFTDGFFSKTVLKTLFRISQLKVSTVFFQNPDDLRELTKTNIINRNKASLLPGSGVNLTQFSYSPLVEKEHDHVNFLLLARMIYPKGIVELVKAAKLLHKKGYTNFHIQLLGELGINNPQAISEEELKEICSPSFVSYLGKTDDVQSKIINSDAVILPSYYREGTPKSLLEALGIGRPIITTKMPGCKETVIDGVNGFLCEPISVEDLADKMEQFLRMSYVEKLKMGEESRKLAEDKYDERIVIRSYMEAITKALSC